VAILLVNTPGLVPVDISIDAGAIEPALSCAYRCMLPEAASVNSVVTFRRQNIRSQEEDIFFIENEFGS
jgi:hypothetical protein